VALFPRNAVERPPGRIHRANDVAEDLHGSATGTPSRFARLDGRRRRDERYWFAALRHHDLLTAGREIVHDLQALGLKKSAAFMYFIAPSAK